MSDRSWVYFLRAGDRLKVGFSRNPEQRIETLKTGCPDPIILLGTMLGGRKEERQIHSTLKNFRANGEWFDLSAESVKTYLSAILPGWEKRKTPHKTGHNYRKSNASALLPSGVIPCPIDIAFGILPDEPMVDLKALARFNTPETTSQKLTERPQRARNKGKFGG